MPQSPQKAIQIFALLKYHYPHAKIILHYGNTWELLVAVMLSAQCTDSAVNKVTASLFKKYKAIKDYANADIKNLEQDIKSTGFYKAKAKNIQNAARMILNRFNGKVPRTMEELTKLPGVGRKTANIVLGNAFNIIEGIAVDTHVRRLSQRLGFSKHTDPEKIEQDLMRLFPKDMWFKLTYLLIEHGRAICEAKKPKCDTCFLNQLCPSAFKFLHFTKQPLTSKKT